MTWSNSKILNCRKDSYDLRYLHLGEGGGVNKTNTIISSNDNGERV